MFKLPKVLNCQASAEMSCRRRDGSLSYYQRLTLATHLIICAGCRHMDRQFALLDTAARRLGFPGASSGSATDNRLSPEARERLKKIVK
jgi:hypothetical protein